MITNEDSELLDEIERAAQDNILSSKLWSGMFQQGGPYYELRRENERLRQQLQTNTEKR